MRRIIHVLFWEKLSYQLFIFLSCTFFPMRYWASSIPTLDVLEKDQTKHTVNPSMDAVHLRAPE